MEEIAGHAARRGGPTREEFREARERELARLNLRLSSLTGEQRHTARDLNLLERDTPRLRDLDREIVRRWAAATRKHAANSHEKGSGSAATPGARASDASNGSLPGASR